MTRQQRGTNSKRRDGPYNSPAVAKKRARQPDCDATGISRTVAFAGLHRVRYALHLLTQALKVSDILACDGSVAVA